MKERILMTVIGLIVILLLSWGVAAVASSFNKSTLNTAVYDVDYHSLTVEDSQSSEIGITEERSGTPDLSGLPKVRAEH
jgi:hypothetical protein